MKQQFDSLQNPLRFDGKQLLLSVTERKILEFQDLDDGWAYGNGIKFTEKIIDDAIKTHDSIINYGFLETDAFPGEGGEILITVYADELYCEVFVYKNNKYDFIIEEHDEEILRKEKIDLDVLIDELKKFRNDLLCTLSEQSIQDTSTRKKEDTKVQPSKIPATTAGFRLLKKFVSSKVQDVCVNILESSTEKFRETQSSSGNFTYPSFQVRT